MRVATVVLLFLIPMAPRPCAVGQNRQSPPIPPCVARVAPVPQPNDPPKSLADLLLNRGYRKSQRELAAATNAARVFVSCSAAQDYNTALTVLKNNEKLFNKVFKGWLQKANDYPTSRPPETLGGYYLPHFLPAQISSATKVQHTE